MGVRTGQPSRRWWRVGLFIAFWAVMGLLDASHSYAKYAIRGTPLSWARALALGLSLWYCWGVLSLGIYWLSRRYPLERRTDWRLWVGFHLLACPAFAFVKILMDYPVIKTFYCPRPHELTLANFIPMAFSSHFHTYLLIYWAMLGYCVALNYQRRCRERERKAALLEGRLAQLELELLKTQLHPHFLCNALHSVSALVHRDADLAERMLARLGDLLRMTLDNADVQEVPLREELAFLRAYLEIEQARLGPRLRVETEVGPDLDDALVPWLLLQPLAENAVRHGIAPNPRAGRLVVRARRVEEQLVLEVEDDGAGLCKAPRPSCRGHGIGLANTRERLQQLYGNQFRFELGRGALGGLLVSVELPLVALAAND
jgi:two-component sensor histidine kinase